MTLNNVRKRFAVVGVMAALGIFSNTLPAQAKAGEPAGLTDRQALGDCATKDSYRGYGKDADHSGMVEWLDACTFEVESTWGVWQDRISGPVVENCAPGASSDIDQRLDATESFATTHSTQTSGVLNIGPLHIGKSYEDSWTKTVSVTSSTTIHVKPGHKAAMKMGAEMEVENGRLRLNYAKRVFDHYVWYVNGYSNSVPTGKTRRTVEDVLCSEKLSNGQ